MIESNFSLTQASFAPVPMNIEAEEKFTKKLELHEYKFSDCGFEGKSNTYGRHYDDYRIFF